MYTRIAVIFRTCVFQVGMAENKKLKGNTLAVKYFSTEVFHFPGLGCEIVQNSWSRECRESASKVELGR